MILRNGINSNLRARGRTALFGVLLLVLTVLLTLGIGTWSYCNATLRQFDKTYTSVAWVEYLGSEYPNADAADPYAQQALAGIDHKAIARKRGVELWQPTDRTLATVQGCELTLGTLPYKSMGVIYCSQFKPKYEYTYTYPNGYSGKKALVDTKLIGYTVYLSQSLYTLKNDHNIYIDLDAGSFDFQPEEGTSYLLHGEFVAGNTAIKKLRLTPFPGGETALPYLAVSGPNDPALTDPDNPFAQYAEFYRIMNRSFELVASNDIPALEAFHQGALTVEQGRMPNANEAGVCLLSGHAAQRMGLALGDTLTVNLLPSDPDNRYTGYKPGMDLEQREVTVVGITNENFDYGNYIWGSSAEGNFGAPLFGYTLGYAVLDNENAQQTAAALQEMLPDQVRVTLYDQGYAGVAAPFKTMRSAALTITLASGAAALATLVLFAYLFVGRQKETVALLHALGTPKQQITVWMLSGAAVIAGAAALAGGIVGGALLETVLRLALGAAQSLYTGDLRYSEKIIGLQLQSEAAGSGSMLSAVFTVLLVVGTAMALCLLLLHSTQKEQAPKRGVIKLHVPMGGTSLWGRGALRYAVLAIKRSGPRKFLAAGAACVLALLVGLLAGTASGWQEQLDDLYANYKLEGQVVSTDGRTYSNLTVSAATARQLWQSGQMDNLYLSQSYHYAPEWAIPDFANNGFGEETKLDWFYTQDSAVFLNHLSAAPELYYSDTPPIDWLEGWDESFLRSEEHPMLIEVMEVTTIRGVLRKAVPVTYPALVSSSFLQKNNLKPGDTFPVRIYYETQADYAQVEILIVGSYTAQSSSSHLYLPLKCAYDPQWIFGETDVISGIVLQKRPASWEQIVDRVKAGTFDTLRFTLKEAGQLDAMRNYLSENGYSMVGTTNRNRTTVLLRDGTFTQTVSNLNRYITFSGLLTPVLLAVVGALGFIISWLLINGRRMECAIMRGMGASRLRVFFSFFWEQMLLCLAGCALAGLLLTVLGNGLLSWLAAGIFALCYLAGTVIAVLLVGRTGLMELLSERE